MRVLVVDDNHLTAEALGTILRAAGHETVTAGSAAEALTRRRAWRPEVVVLDVVLPDRSGLDLLRDLRDVSAREGLPRVPVVLATALSGGELAAVERSMAAYQPARLLAKPFDPPDLLALLEEMVPV